MSSNLNDKNSKLIYTKPTTKKFQLTRLSIKSNKKEKTSEQKRKTDYLITYTKTPSKSKFFDENYIKHNIKSMHLNAKKRQNKFIHKKFTEKEKSCFLNININKIINQKEYSIMRRSDRTSAGNIDSVKSYKSNFNNITNKNKSNIFQEKNAYKSIRRKKFESNISNININKTTKINSSNTTIKNSNNKNRFGLLSPKEIINNKFTSMFNNNNEENLNDFNKYELKLGQQTNIKSKDSNNQKNNFNGFFGKEIKYNNIMKVNNANIKVKRNYINDINNKNYNINKIKEKMNKNEKNINVEKLLKSKSKSNVIKNKKKHISSNNNEKNNINNFDKKEIINKKNLNPVKKSLFSEHMNFLNNLTEDRNVNYEKNKNDNNYNNLNYLNIPINNILQSTENKEFESKFINYDLGRTSGTSQIKDSLIAFEINDNHGDNKIPKLLNIQKNINFFNEEKERTKDELEKLADQFLNQSKNLEIKKDLYKKDESQINTITTIVDNNFNEDSM